MGLVGQTRCLFMFAFHNVWELSHGSRKNGFIARKMFPLRIFANKSSIIGESFLDRRGSEASHEINFKMI